MSNAANFQKLMEPGYIGKIRTRNRMIKNGTHPGFFPWADGYVHDKYIDLYEAWAKGGIGLLVVGAANIDYPMGLAANLAYRIDDDKYIDSFAAVTRAIRKYHCPAFIQMFHLGPMFGQLPTSGPQTVAASSIPKNELPKPHFSVARELTIPQIQDIVEKFASAAVRAQKAGFEGIELNGGCAHLLNSFYSRAWNRRQDEYGFATMENRTRIGVQIIQEIKRRLGKDFPIIALFNVAEAGLEKGITSEESQQIAKILEKAGADAIHARVEYYAKPKEREIRDSTHFPDVVCYPECPHPVEGGVDGSRHGAGGWVPLAIAVKKVVSVPVIAVGRLDAELGEKLIGQGKIDFIAINRRIIADPEYPNKVGEGRLEDIAPCTACMTCFDHCERGLEPICRVNAAIGKEKEYVIRPAAQKKKVMVVGGGPAGMETARVAALRGHQVTLFEKENKLGGALHLAGIVKGFEREDLELIVRYLQTQIAKLGVEVRLGKEVNRALIEEVKPDVLIVATGGIHNIPQVPGINTRKVLTSQQLHQQLKRYMNLVSPGTLRSLTSLWMPIGKRVVVMGGNIQGCQTAEFLVKRGRQVTIVETGNKMGDGLLDIFMKPNLLLWLAEKGVRMMPGVKYEEITDKGLTITTKEGKKELLEADTIVTALPLLPNNELLKAANDLVKEVYNIGDCKEPRMIVDAVADGSSVGRRI